MVHSSPAQALLALALLLTTALSAESQRSLRASRSAAGAGAPTWEQPVLELYQDGGSNLAEGNHAEKLDLAKVSLEACRKMPACATNKQGATFNCQPLVQVPGEAGCTLCRVNGAAKCQMEGMMNKKLFGGNAAGRDSWITVGSTPSLPVPGAPTPAH